MLGWHGIINSATLTLNQCNLSGNTGDGIFNGFHATLTLNQCTLSGNSASDLGGGIYNDMDGIATLNQCTLSGNSGVLGGSIFNNEESTATLNQCTLSGNSAWGGGGIYNFIYATLTLNQCTLSGNSATNGGGGIFNNGGTATLKQCTFSGNTATHGGSGGGIYNGDGTLSLTNTIVAGNSGSLGADILNTYILTYGGSNLVQTVYNGNGGTITGPAPLTDAPNLAPLGNYGGPTQTMPPLPGSPAIGAGSVAANTFSTDQRGYPRTQNRLIDLGAVELQPPAANPPVLENITLPAGGGERLAIHLYQRARRRFHRADGHQCVVGIDHLDGAGRGPASRAGPVSIHRPAGGHQHAALLPRAFAVMQQFTFTKLFMKTKIKNLLPLLLLLGLPGVVQAQDAYSTNADGSIYTYSTNADGSANIVAYAGPPWVVTIPTNINGLTVTSIGNRALEETALTSITIPGSVTSIGAEAFYYCHSLTSVTILNGITNIGAGAFQFCTSLMSVTIPNSVTSIGANAFYYVYSLTNAIIGNSVTNIGGEAFFDCTSLTSITVDASNPAYSSLSGVLFDKRASDPAAIPPLAALGGVVTPSPTASPASGLMASPTARA